MKVKLNIQNGSLYTKIRQQVAVPRKILLGSICDNLRINNTPQNLKIMNGLLRSAIDDTGRIKEKHLPLVTSGLRARFKVNLSETDISDILKNKNLTIKWDRDTANKDTANLLEAISQARDIPSAINGLKLSFNKLDFCSGFEVWRGNLDTLQGKIVFQENMLAYPFNRPKGEVSQAALRAGQIKGVMDGVTDNNELKLYMEKARFYGIWHLKDRRYWLEYGMDQKVLNEFKLAYFPMLDVLYNKYTGKGSNTGAYSLAFQKILDTEKKNLYICRTDLDLSVRPLQYSLIRAYPKDQEKTASRFKEIKDDIMTAADKALDQAYDLAENNIKKWSAAKQGEKRRLDLSIKDVFLNREIFNRVMYNFNNAMEDLKFEASLSQFGEQFIRESLNMVIYDYNYGVAGVVSGNNFKKNISQGFVTPLFDSLEAKQGRIRLYEKLLNASSTIFQRGIDNTKTQILLDQQKETSRDLQLALELSTKMHKSGVSIKKRLMSAAEQVYKIIKKNGSEVGVSIQLISNNDPNYLEVVAYHNKPASILKTPPQKIGTGIAGQVALTGQALPITDVELYFSNPQAFGIKSASKTERKYASQSLLSIPLKLGNVVIGVLNVDGPRLKGNEADIMQAGVQMIADAIANAKLTKKLILQSSIDELTGLYVREVFNEDIIQLLSDAENGKVKDFAVFYFDIDDFKDYNDTKGHQAGDVILRNVGKVSKEIAEKRGKGKLILDLISEKISDKGRGYRMGGEENTLVLPNVAIKEAVKVALELKNDIEKAAGVTISIGVISYKNDSLKDLDDVIKKSDKLMYISKNTGKNQVALMNKGKVYRVKK